MRQQILEIGVAATFAVLVCAGPAAADDAQGAWSHQIAYQADIIGPVSGGQTNRGTFIDELDVIVDGDLGKAIGWSGATVHAFVLNNSGGHPNDAVGAIEGIDGREPGHLRTRIYELWMQQAVPNTSVTVRAGLYDVNSEFYTTAASGVLIAPAFGAATVFSHSGPFGPSVFPLSSLALRIKAGGDTGAYGQLAVVDAHAGTLNEPADLKLGFDRGAMVIGEAGVHGATHLAVGAWIFTDKQNDIHDLTTGAADRSEAHGVYGLAERELWTGANGARAAAFARVGASDGKTGVVSGSWQAGLRFDGVCPSRPKSAASIGLEQAILSDGYRQNARALGSDLARSETGLEITYADNLGRLTVQPDLQFLRHPGGRTDDRTAVVVGTRFIINLS
jgi:porin